jgi:putative N6-adenine-specific DNA methylase
MAPPRSRSHDRGSQSAADERPFFATAAKGTEGALRDELRELRIPRIRADRGGVHFGGDVEHAMRACLRSRIALRVLWRVAEFASEDKDALYEGARSVDWSRWLDARSTMAVSATVKHGALRHSGYVAQRIKDAVVDQIREREGQRPDVERRSPDVHVVAHLARDSAQIYVDFAGESLSRRGYRTESGEAPLRENLAAAMLRLSGYRPGTPFLDPMCGSGTLPIEAAMWAAGLPSGAHRRFGFMRWRCFDQSARASWELEEQRARDFANPVATAVCGSDRDAELLPLARANAARAGVDVSFECAELATVRVPPAGSLIVTNPPYGLRLERTRAQADRWLRDFRRALERLRESTVVVITPERDLPRALGLRATHEHTLYNGDLECRLFTWTPG